MSVFLERFLLAVFAAVAGTTILTNPWRLDRVQQLSLIVAIGALAVLAGRTIERNRSTAAGPPSVGGSTDHATLPTHSPDFAPPTVAQGPSDPASLPPAPIGVAPPATEAEAAADHYRRTSPTLKREEIREAYRQYCDNIAKKFGLPNWAPLNQLTRMVAVNMGDGDAYERAEKERPSTTWAAIRVLVAFETPKERPMYMSYIFIGRTPDGEEVVAIYDSHKSWKVLGTTTTGAADPESVIVKSINEQLQELGTQIAPDIRRLK